MGMLPLDIVRRFAAATGSDTSRWTVRLQNQEIVVSGIEDANMADLLAAYIRKTIGVEPVVYDHGGWSVICRTRK